MPPCPVLLSTGKADGPGHLDRVTGLVCYGSTVGSCSWDLSLRLWDLPRCLSEVANGEEPKPSHVILDAHDDYILGMAYAPELEQIASASADQGVKLCAQTTPLRPNPNPRPDADPDNRRPPMLCMGRGVRCFRPFPRCVA